MPVTKKKVGRPPTSVAQKLSKIPFDLQKIEQMAREGLIDVQIAAILGVNEKTLNNWKENPEFLAVLKKGKEFANAQVQKSLFQRAIGYDHEDTYFSSYQGVVTATPYIKHWAPDVMAGMYWMNNRDRENWKMRQDITSNGETLIAYTITTGDDKKND